MRASRVRDVQHERNRRSEYFRSELFSDPAWDILLDLYAAELAQNRVAVSQVGSLSNVPVTTAGRWLKLLESEGLVVRKLDPLDARRSFAELTFKGSHAMSGYFRAGSG